MTFFEERLNDEQIRCVQVVSSLVRIIEEKDHYTYGHSQRVAYHSVAVGFTFNLSNEKLSDLAHAALLHDIGKIGICDKVLHKTTPLTEDEKELIRTHPSRGFHILQPLHLMKRFLPTILAHHERFDGKGYPNGLQGEQIPLEARIVAVCDAYDAITSDRAYRKAKPKSEALQRIREEAGKQFDPQVVKNFCDIIESNIYLDFISRHVHKYFHSFTTICQIDKLRKAAGIC